MAAPIDLRRYGTAVEFLQERQRRVEGQALGPDRQPQWGDVTNEWAREHLRLEGDQLEYFIDGLNLVAGGVHAKTRHWLDLARDDDLDEEIWLFVRAWLDHYGPLYDTIR